MTDIPSSPKKQDPREIAAQAVLAALGRPSPLPSEVGDAVLLALREAGYQIIRPHDWAEDQDPLRRAQEYPRLALQCRRCGARNTDLGLTSCEVAG